VGLGVKNRKRRKRPGTNQGKGSEGDHVRSRWTTHTELKRISYKE